MSCGCCGRGGRSSTIASASLQGTVSTTALTLLDFGFTQDEIDAAKKMYVYVNSGSIRVDWSGGIPTVASGAVISGSLELSPNANIQLFQMIRNGGTDSEVFIILES